MVTGAPVWNVGSGLPQKAASKAGFDHRELGIMPVNSLERLGNFLGNTTKYTPKTKVYIVGSGIILYLD